LYDFIFTMYKNLKGRRGEGLATAFLKEKNFTIRETNWRAGKHEVDIIAEKDNFLIFVEVKTRATWQYGDPSEMVSRPQRNRIVMAANRYLEQFGQKDWNVRFDIISVLESGECTEMDHIEDAFYPMVNKIKI
jgi:putative endonuclease